MEAINDLCDQDRAYITSVQHAKLLDQLRMDDKLTYKGKGLLNSEGKPKTKLEAKMRREEESKLPNVPLWHGNTVDILKDCSNVQEVSSINSTTRKALMLRRSRSYQPV